MVKITKYSEKYAFLVRIDHYYDGTSYLPEDYPYCSYNRDETWAPDSGDIDHLSLGLCTVVGTLDDIRKVFDETEPMDGWYCYVWSAPRPDMVEKIKESGWTGTSDLLGSYSGHSDFYKSILGEEKQVTINIKVKK